MAQAWAFDNSLAEASNEILQHSIIFDMSMTYAPLHE